MTTSKCATLLIALFTVFLLMTASSTVIAQTINSNGSYSQSIEKKLTQINQQLSTRSTKYGELNQLVLVINRLQGQTDACIKVHEARVAQINLILQQIESAVSFKPGTSINNDLQNEKIDEINQLAFCRFYKFKLQDAYNLAESRLKHFGKNPLFSKEKSVLQVLNSDWLFSTTITTEMLDKKSGIEQLNRIQRLSFVMLCFLGIALGIYRGLTRWIPPKKTGVERFGELLKQSYLLLFPLLFIDLYANIALHKVYPTASIVLLLNALTVYCCALFLVRCYVTLGKAGKLWSMTKSHNVVFNSGLLISLWIYDWVVTAIHYGYKVIPIEFLQMRHILFAAVILKLGLVVLTRPRQFFSTENSALILKKTSIIATITFLCYVPLVFLYNQPVPAQCFELLDTFYITILNLVLLWLSWLIVPLLIFKQKKTRVTKTVLGVLYGAIILLGWMGYHQFAMLFILKLTITIMAFIIMWDLSLFIKYIYVLLSDPEQRTSQAFRRKLGIKPQNKLIELFIIRIGVYVLIIAATTLGLLGIWGGVSAELDLGFGALGTGFTFFGSTIYPIRLVRAGFIFSIIVLAGRMLSVYVEQHALALEEKNTKLMIASLIGYATLAIAVLTALFIVGINPRGIIVIAGALSVGIGFGLQHFASDFISGILLMINKPVKVGDHVIIDDTEGFIKKIGALSTQLTTLIHSDVIIPNSSLIVKSVTNYTFRNNRLFRLKIVVILTNDSDFEPVKEILLRVATNNSNVIQTAPYQPTVLFELNHLELWITIDEVDKKQYILSTINLALANELKEKNIVVTKQALL